MKSKTKEKPRHSEKTSQPVEETATTSGMKTVFLAVSGMSPAIITESLWALAAEKPPVIPDEVVVITTVKGREDIERLLQTPCAEWGGLSVWKALQMAILGKKDDPRLQFATPRVIELSDEVSGCRRPAEDLRTPKENAEAADFIVDEVRKYTENPSVRLIASIAGGRKTMGAFLYAAMNLLGREDDRVTHVLVSPPFDLCPGFFFPGQPVTELVARGNGKPLKLNANEAEVTLADVPFVSLRNLFENNLGELPGSFSLLVARCRTKVTDAGLKSAYLVVCDDRLELKLNGKSIQLSLLEYLLMRYLAERTKHKERPIGSYADATNKLDNWGQSLYEARDRDDSLDWKKNIGEITWDAETIARGLSRVRSKLRRANFAKCLIDELLPQKGRFALNLDSSQIEIEKKG